MAWVFYQKGDVDRLNLGRKEGSRGIINVEECIKIEQKNFILRSMYL